MPQPEAGRWIDPKLVLGKLQVERRPEDHPKEWLAAVNQIALLQPQAIKARWSGASMAAWSSAVSSAELSLR